MRKLIMVIWVLWLSACSQPQRPEVDAQHCASRSWSGWAYVDGVGDFPLRIRETADGGSLDVGFIKLYDWPLNDFKYADQSLQFTWLAKSGDPGCSPVAKPGIESKAASTGPAMPVDSQCIVRPVRSCLKTVKRRD